MATIKKTQPSCTKVKVKVDLAAKLPDHVEIKVINNITKEERIKTIKIQYDMLPKYCYTCNIQGHEEVECRSLHPKLKVLDQQYILVLEQNLQGGENDTSVQKKN